MKSSLHQTALRIASFAWALVVLAVSAKAALFSYGISSSDPGAPANFSRSFSSYEDVSEFVDSFDYTAYDTINYTESITLFGKAGAIIVQNAASSGPVVVSSPVIGLTRNFADADEAEAYYDSQQAIDDLIAVIKKLAQLSPVTLVDGSPKAQTAASAQTVFETFAFTPLAGLDFAQTESASSPLPGSTPEDSKRGWLAWGIYADQSRFTVDLPGGGEVNGSDSKVSVPFGFNFGERVSFRAGVLATFTEIEGTETYGMNVYAGLPVKLIAFSPTRRFQWQVTPFGAVGAAGSLDSAIGSATYSGGGTNLLEYRLSRDWILSFATQYSFYESLDVLEDYYDAAVPVSQRILKNGVRLRWRAAPRWILEGFVVDSRFLKDAAIDGYETIGGGVSFKITKRWFVTLGSKYEFGDDYTGWNIGLSSGWNF